MRCSDALGVGDDAYHRRVSAYLDHAATTPMRPEAVEAMTAAMVRVGNPSSMHGAGRAARRLVEESREAVAEALGARPSEVVFTSGGTEADNLAVKGLYWARHEAEPRRTRVLVGAGEHHAVLDPARWLAESQGASAELVALDPDGRVTPGALAAALGPQPSDVALVSVMWANNEVGALSPVAELTALAHDHGIPVHSDAVQAAATLPVDFAATGLDAMTVTGHKLGGPLGVGALLLSRTASAVPVLHGGGQERDVRSGTLDTPAIAGFAAAILAAAAERATTTKRLAALRERLVRGVLARVPDAVVNGPTDPGQRLPGTAHLSFPGCEGDALLMLLDAQGVECSTGSACSAGVPRASHVLLAMGVPEPLARGSLRFSLGHTSTDGDVDALLTAVAGVVERARRAGLTSMGAALAGTRS